MGSYNFPDEPGIYRCVCLNTGRSYVGQSVSLAKRKQEHLNSLKRHNHPNSYLQRSWDKHGEYNFDWHTIETCQVEELDDLEIYWIEHYEAFKDGYNHTIGGGGARGFKHSEESKEKRRQRMLGANNPMYGRTGALNPAYGKDHSGSYNGMFGKHQTEQAKELNRRAHLGRKNANSKPVVCVETDQFFWSMGEAKRATGCDDTTITRCCRGIKKTCGGYHWRYATDEEIELHNNYMTG